MPALSVCSNILTINLLHQYFIYGLFGFRSELFHNFSIDGLFSTKLQGGRNLKHPPTNILICCPVILSFFPIIYYAGQVFKLYLCGAKVISILQLIFPKFPINNKNNAA
jgi:hypothetical protein